jgi:hypothetical protein
MSHVIDTSKLTSQKFNMVLLKGTYWQGVCVFVRACTCMEKWEEEEHLIEEKELTEIFPCQGRL